MVRSLLIRGMLVGVVAGLLAFAFARVFGEPGVDSAIAFEESMQPAEAAPSTPASAQGSFTPVPSSPGMAHDHGGGSGAEEVLFSRDTQAGLGLFTGVVVYGAALGGLFALVFAFVHGRLSRLGPQALAALIASVAFVAIVVVPALKYPASPPAVGLGETIGYRTALFLVMLAVSLAAVVVAAIVRNALLERLGRWNAGLAAAALFILIVGVAMALLPGIDEVPEHFPATVLWQFRIASLGTQAVLWAVIGLGFGLLTERNWPRAA
jgi:hypothetical protein